MDGGYAMGGMGTLVEWKRGQCLQPPYHCIWVERSDHDPVRIEILLNEVVDGEFRFRRDHSM